MHINILQGLLLYELIITYCYCYYSTTKYLEQWYVAGSVYLTSIIATY